MSAITHGMNPDEVESLGRTLKMRANELNQLVSQLNGLVHNTGWNGPDASNFKGPWWDGHRSHLTKIAQDLDGFGQSALNNASAQRQASGQ
jgi:hypothetical protein